MIERGVPAPGGHEALDDAGCRDVAEPAAPGAEDTPSGRRENCTTRVVDAMSNALRTDRVALAVARRAGFPAPVGR